MSAPSPESFLRLIEDSRRGRLKVYLGYGPGVGKSYQMLLEGHRLKGQGVDVVIGYVEDHGRADTRSLTLGLPLLPRRHRQYRGIELAEMDLDALLQRTPQVALIDELAHTNIPGSRHAKRYQDVLEVLKAGISVITTVNVQHLESLYDTVERLVGVRVKERVPDWVLAEADQIVNVDLAAEDLHRRLEEGKVYPQERVATSLANFFRRENLEQLRELTLREVASFLERRGRRGSEERRVTAPDQVAVCLSSRGPDAAALLRYASRLAGRLDRTWYALYVQTPDEDPTRIAAATQRHLAETLELATRLGATVFTYKARDVVDAVVAFTREYQIGHLVVGRPGRRPWWRRICGGTDLVRRLVERTEGLTLVVADPAARPAPRAPEVAAPPARTPPLAPSPPPTLTALLQQGAIEVFAQPAARQEVLERLVSALVARDPRLDGAQVLRALHQREAQGSTFLEEGIGLPHARIPGLDRPCAGLAVLRSGLIPTAGQTSVDAVLLLLTPEHDNQLTLQLMSQAARLLPDRSARTRLSALNCAAEVLVWLRESER